MKGLRQTRLIANVFGAGGARLLSMAVAILSVPLLLQLLGKERYGVWVTLTSILVWFSMLDLGVGNSLRNTVSAMVNEDMRGGVQQEFHALLHLLGIVALGAALLLMAAVSAFPLLLAHPATSLLLYLPALIMLPLLLGGSVLQGAGKVGLQATLQSAPAWLFFLFVVACHFSGWNPSLSVYAIVWSVCALFCAGFLFSRALIFLRLPLSYVLCRQSGAWPWQRLQVGLSFLVLQVATLVLYSMGNVIIYSGLGAGEVARYDVLNKVFQVGMGLYGVVITVMWSEIARLRALEDWAALRVYHMRMLGIAMVFSAGAFVVAWLMPVIVSLWTGRVLSVARQEAMALALLVSLQAIAYVGAVFLNAFEQVKIQVVLALVSIVVMYPLSRVLLSAGLGIAAVPLAAAALTILPLLVCNMQAYRLLRMPRYA